MSEDKQATQLTQNKAIVRKLLAAWNRRGETYFPAELVGPTLVTRFPEPVTATVKAKQLELKSEPALPKEAFPDQQFEEQIVIAEDDLVFIAWSVSGTHSGPLYGRAATGKKVTVYGADAVRLANGKIVEHWNYYAKARVTALAKLGLLDQTMQDLLLSKGLLGPGKASGVLWPQSTS